MPRSRVFKNRKGKKASKSKSVPEVEQTCAKERKIPDIDESFSAESTGKGVLNCILDLNILGNVFKNCVNCKNCNSGLELQVMKSTSGLALSIILKCFKCDYTHEFSSSEFHEGTQIAVVNIRFVYALRSIGKEAEAGRMLCAIMNLSQPPTRFQHYNTRLLDATQAVCDSTMKKAAKDAIVENNRDKNIPVAVDGTWQKRGYMSNNGVVTVTSMDTGKVIDVEVLSKYCACKRRQNHEKSCKSNFRGSSGMMEVKGACDIFKRSLTVHDARYTKYLGDGDSKAFDTIKKENIYGAEFQVEKLECIGHVMKRMGSRLRRLKEKKKGQLLSDGKGLSGKNRLTDSQIDKIQNYYGLAIRRNLNSVHDMRQAIWAIFMHKLSNDEHPQHGFCPIGKDSWCGFKKAEAAGSAYKHKSSLPVAVVEAMRPVFKDLSHPDLLKKCVHGNTQNPNESMNNVIWSRVPKSTFVQIETLSLGVYDAVCTFNEGNSAKLQVLKNLGIEPGEYTFQALKCLDKEKLARAKYAFSQQSKERRKKKRSKRKREEEINKNNAHIAGYGPGKY